MCCIYNQKGKRWLICAEILICSCFLAAVALGGCDSRTTQPVQQPHRQSKVSRNRRKIPQTPAQDEQEEPEEKTQKKGKRSRKKNSRRKSRRAKNRRKRKANRKRTRRKPLPRSRTRRMTATLRWSSRCMLPASLSRIFHRNSRSSWMPMTGMSF